jgi:hypothetical protein
MEDVVHNHPEMLRNFFVKVSIGQETYKWSSMPQKQYEIVVPKIHHSMNNYLEKSKYLNPDLK